MNYIMVQLNSQVQTFIGSKGTKEKFNCLNPSNVKPQSLIAGISVCGNGVCTNKN